MIARDWRRTAFAFAILIALAFCCAFAGPAAAETSRPLIKTLNVGAGQHPQAVATDSAGNFYVVEWGTQPRVEKFDAEGNPVNFTASGTYISGNKLTGTPAEPVFEFQDQLPNGIAVSRAPGPTNGYIYVTNPFRGVFAFKASGEYLGQFDNENVFYEGGVAVNPTNGNVYASDYTSVRRYVPSAAPNGQTPKDTMAGPQVGNYAIASDGAGNFFLATLEYSTGPLYKYPETVFGTGNGQQDFLPSASAISFDTASGDLFVARGSDIVQVHTNGTQVGGPFGGFELTRGVAVGSGDRVYASEPNGQSVSIFGPAVNLQVVKTGQPTEVLQTSATANGEVDPSGAGPITKCEFQWGTDATYSKAPVPCSPATPYAAPTKVSANLTGMVSDTVYHYRVITTGANGVRTGADVSFRTPKAVADVATGEAAPVTKDSALLHASYRGQNLETTYYFDFGKDGSFGQKYPAVPASTGKENGPQEVDPILVTGLKGATEYHYRVVMTNELGTVVGEERTFTTPPAITNLTTGDATNVGKDSAELNGSFIADSYETKYFFEWGPTEAYGNSTPVPPGTALPPGSGTVNVPPVLIENLQQGGIYHYRIVASNSAGTTYGGDRSFKTAEPPQISNLAAKNILSTSVDLTAEINPNRGATEWFFEWGLTTSYGNTSPVPPGSIAAGSNPVPVSTHLEGLKVGSTYHFRLVAKNEFGERSTGDQSFGFYPPECPNSQIRQETGSSHLPECRAYELVSPGDARGTLLFPYNAPTTSEASHPSRFVYSAGFGDPGVGGEPIISVTDMYVASRSSSGWTSKYTGLSARDATFMGGAPHSSVYGTTQYGPSNTMVGTAVQSDLDRVAIYDLGYPGFNEQLEPASNAPYIFDGATGQTLDQWPTNVENVAKGTTFVGWQEFSDDMSHFVFSSNVAFVPGAEEFEDEIGCCSLLYSEWHTGRCCPAPIYDNNTDTGEIDLISEREDGSSFWGTPVDTSPDGSRILMAEGADWIVDLNSPLFMRAGGQTLDIAHGAPVRFIEMTKDASTVYFSSNQQLTADDHDTSKDIFVWHLSEPGKVVRVSKGSTGNNGDRDNCAQSWVEKCNIQIIDVHDPLGHGFGNGDETGNEISDDVVADQSGDIYFVSPEQLDGARGSFGQANIYLYHEGEVRFVASGEAQPCQEPPWNFAIETPNCEAAKIRRMQVTPDGKFAAFVSSSRLTPYDNSNENGSGEMVREMYVYDREAERVDCASCKQDGTRPGNPTRGSQNGRFITDDGRVFFATNDSLLPTDTNKANDVYEYVEGKAQLITTGIGAGCTNFGFQCDQNGPGLINVSADGTDVYFGTMQRLVDQDHNGQELKIYDARIGGGFPAEPPKTECAAADECHGLGSEPPALPKDRTSVELEGNQKQKSAKKAKKHKKHKKSKKKKAKKKRAAKRGKDSHAG